MKNRLLKDTLIYGGGDFLFKFISFAVFPLYAFKFSLTEFGIIELVNTTIMFFSGFYSLGLNFSIARLYWDYSDPIYQRKLISTGFWGTFLGSFSISLVAFALLFVFKGPLYEVSPIDWRLFSIAIFGNIASVCLQYIRDVFRIKFESLKYFILASSENLSKISLALGMIYFMQMGLDGYFWGLFIGAWITLLIGSALVSKQVAFVFDFVLFKKSVSYGMPVIIGGIATWIYSVSDRWILAELSSSEEVGLYAIAFKFASLLFFIYIAFGMAFFPYAMKQSNEDATFADRLPVMFTNWMAMTLLFCIGLSLFASELLHFTTPEKYWSASNLVMLTTSGYWVFCSAQFSSLGIHISKKTSLFIPVAWGVAIFNIFLNILMAPSWGAIGSSIATLLANMLLTGLYFYFSHKFQPYAFDWYKLLSLIAIMVCTGSLVVYLNQFAPNITLFAIKSLLFVAITSLMVGLKLVNISFLTPFLTSILNTKPSRDI